MENVLLEEIEYKVEETNFGVWRRFGYIDGTSFHEFRSHSSWMGLPLVHYTFGRNPETGRRVVAKGVIAVGRLACGIVAIGHASFGLVAIGQLALGLGVGLGQFATGLAVLAQFGLGIVFGLAQFATGYIAIGQFAVGRYVLAQMGSGEFVWSMTRADPQAIEFFKSLPIIRHFLL